MNHACTLSSQDWFEGFTQGTILLAWKSTYWLFLGHSWQGWNTDSGYHDNQCSHVQIQMQTNHAWMLSGWDLNEGSTQQTSPDCTNWWFSFFLNHGWEGRDTYDGCHDVEWMPWCPMLLNIDTNANESCLEALQLWSVWVFQQTTHCRLHKLQLWTVSTPWLTRLRHLWWMQWCPMFFYIDTNVNESCLQAL